MNGRKRSPLTPIRKTPSEIQNLPKIYLTFFHVRENLWNQGGHPKWDRWISVVLHSSSLKGPTLHFSLHWRQLTLNLLGEEQTFNQSLTKTEAPGMGTVGRLTLPTKIHPPVSVASPASTLNKTRPQLWSSGGLCHHPALSLWATTHAHSSVLKVTWNKKPSLFSIKNRERESHCQSRLHLSNPACGRPVYPNLPAAPVFSQQTQSLPASPNSSISPSTQQSSREVDRWGCLAISCPVLWELEDEGEGPWPQGEGMNVFGDCLSRLVPGPAGACLGPGSLRGAVLIKHRCWSVCPWGSEEKNSVELGLSCGDKERLWAWLAMWVVGRGVRGWGKQCPSLLPKVWLPLALYGTRGRRWKGCQPGAWAKPGRGGAGPVTTGAGW